MVRPALLLLLALAASLAAETTAALWGARGESWRASSRLPDCSYAGYRRGEAAIPRLPVVTDVTRFGAVGDGRTDCTAAFRAAVAATHDGAVNIPRGRWVLRDVVTLDHSRCVLRGAGPGATVLVIPQSLQQLHPVPLSAEGKAPYAFHGGFVTLKGGATGRLLAKLAARAPRGSERLTLDAAPAGLKPGDLVRLVAAGSPALGRVLHAGLLDPGVATAKEMKTYLNWVAGVAAVDGRVVALDRPLRLELEPAFGVEMHSYAPTVEDVGVEELTFEFPGVPKKKHLVEEGFNAIQMSGVTHAWVRGVEILDADCGIIVGGCRWCTVSQVVFRAPKRKAPSGHHALWATGGSQDCLFAGFRVETEYVHDLSVEGLANGNVFVHGAGHALNLDHHRNMPYENLFTDLDAGSGARLWQSSGRGDRGPHAGARETAWHITHHGAKLDKLPDWPQLNVVGVKGYPAGEHQGHVLVEAPDGVTPHDLFSAQRARRLGAGAVELDLRLPAR